MGHPSIQWPVNLWQSLIRSPSSLLQFNCDRKSLVENSRIRLIISEVLIE